ncbi:hypothetical protein [Roseicitreum antarcticum]|uniref:hypothetical protein n=1 Tax=Roseicitreum antarcticum TaxID=564137 RepID=UPI001CC1C92E|nr:hypothetical protein [Roseicitreum antarcticum]
MAATCPNGSAPRHDGKAPALNAPAASSAKGVMGCRGSDTRPCATIRRRSANAHGRRATPRRALKRALNHVQRPFVVYRFKECRAKRRIDLTI